MMPPERQVEVQAAAEPIVAAAFVHRRAAQLVRRDAHAAAFQPALVREAHAGGAATQHRGGGVQLRRESRRRTRLVVVLEEARQAILMVEVGLTALAHRAGIRLAQAVVQAFVVVVVETLLLQRSVQVPVGLGHEGESGSRWRAARGAAGHEGSPRGPRLRSKTLGSTGIAWSQRRPS
jgi:hypothetical protein